METFCYLWLHSGNSHFVKFFDEIHISVLSVVGVRELFSLDVIRSGVSGVKQNFILVIIGVHNFVTKSSLRIRLHWNPETCLSLVRNLFVARSAS